MEKIIKKTLFIALLLAIGLVSGVARAEEIKSDVSKVGIENSTKEPEKKKKEVTVVYIERDKNKKVPKFGFDYDNPLQLYKRPECLDFLHLINNHVNDSFRGKQRFYDQVNHTENRYIDSTNQLVIPESFADRFSIPNWQPSNLEEFFSRMEVVLEKYPHLYLKENTPLKSIKENKNQTEIKKAIVDLNNDGKAEELIFKVRQNYDKNRWYLFWTIPSVALFKTTDLFFYGKREPIYSDFIIYKNKSYLIFPNEIGSSIRILTSVKIYPVEEEYGIITHCDFQKPIETLTNYKE